MAAVTDLPDLEAVEFASIKARLARAYLDHKAALGAPGATDEAIVESVDHRGDAGRHEAGAGSAAQAVAHALRLVRRSRERVVQRPARQVARQVTQHRRSRCVRLPVFARRDGRGIVGSSVARPPDRPCVGQNWRYVGPATRCRTPSRAASGQAPHRRFPRTHCVGPPDCLSR